MAFKPNYQQERGNRNRAKEQKKQEKLRKREESTAARRAASGDAEDAVPAPQADPGLPRAEQE